MQALLPAAWQKLVAWLPSLWPGRKPNPATQAASVGALGFDTDTALTASSAAAFAAAGFSFAIRYLSRQTPESASDLSAAEAALILDAGLRLMAVQHVAPAGWTPSAALGSQYGQAAVQNAQAATLPKGMNLWLDLEGVASNVDSAQVTDYCNSWFSAVTAAGYLPGLYIGANNGLQLPQASLQCEYFWQSASRINQSPNIGYCLLQSLASDALIAGVSYDQNRVQADSQGKTPIWACALQESS